LIYPFFCTLPIIQASDHQNNTEDARRIIMRAANNVPRSPRGQGTLPLPASMEAMIRGRTGGNQPPIPPAQISKSSSSSSSSNNTNTHNNNNNPGPTPLTSTGSTASTASSGYSSITNEAGTQDTVDYSCVTLPITVSLPSGSSGSSSAGSSALSPSRIIPIIKVFTFLFIFFVKISQKIQTFV
jgi:hypothetical protein